jgi:hypothetical protein
MFEPRKRLYSLNTAIRGFVRRLFCHRMIYAGLTVCHAFGCAITDKPQLYGPMAVLYAILAVLG